MTDASEIEATDFYAKMSKPDAPMAGGILGAARSAQERPSVLRTICQARRFAHVEASGEPAERPIAEIDEQRRQEEAGSGQSGCSTCRCDAMARASMSRSWIPSRPTSPTTSPSTFSTGEGEQIGAGLVAAGLGLTTAASFMQMGVEASRRGPLTDHEVQQRNADGMKVLQERWGDQTGAKLQVAKAMIKEASAKWPGLKDYLNATGLGAIRNSSSNSSQGPNAGRAPQGETTCPFSTDKTCSATIRPSRLQRLSHRHHRPR